ncbi:MAG TPA: ABC transporter permease [Vicinamibacterales bacterium]|nr:ABC transporter permease [Vicinamibacterales bacterium]
MASSAPLLQPIRVGLRALTKTPAFALGAIVTIALTVGTTTAVFSVVYAVLLRQLPYRDVDRVFWIWSDQPGRDRTPFNVPDFIDYRDGAGTLEGFAGLFGYGASLSDEAAGERVQGLRATGNLFDVLGARARAGRLLEPADERPGADHVVVLTDRFWSRRFGGDPGILGRPIRLNGEAYVVVGVLAPGFVVPVRDVEFVVPFGPDSDPRRGARNSLNFIIGAGRIRDGVSASQTAGELVGIARRLQARFPVENARKRGVQMIRAIDGVAGSFRAALLTIFAAVCAVLLIACANLANLMLARAATRRKEIAMHLALGASRARVAWHCLIEALLVGLAGGALGVLLAQWGVLALLTLAPAELPRVGDVRIDAAVLTFSLCVSLLTGALFGVVPALVSSRVDVRDALQGSGRGATAGGGHVRGALVSGEVALAVVLLIVMTLLAKSFARVQAVAPGFEPAQVLSARLTLPPKRFTSRESLVALQMALRERVSALASVSQTGAITLPPLTGLLARVPFTVEGRPVERERIPLAQFRTVSPGYFETLRIPLKRGRAFSDGDTGATRSVAVVNEALAARWLAGLEPIGARLLVDDSDGPPRPVEVVGVVGNVQQIALDATDPTWDLYLTYAQIHADTLGGAVGNMFWLTRTAGDPMALATPLVRELRRVDRDVVASQLRPLEQNLVDAIAPRRFSVTLMAAFGLAALVLAATGIYAVIAYSVSQRAREIGIRIALGARNASIMRLVVGEGARFVVAGLAAGIAMAAGLLRLLTSLLFGVTSSDIATFVQVSASVSIVALVACAVPTVRALRLPAVALHTE